MGDQNSHVSTYADLLCVLLEDNHLPKSAQSSIQRDVVTVRRRCSAEGLSFLTIELPKIGKALDFGLESGVFPLVDGFRRRSGHVVPEFLSAATTLIFAPDGALLDNPDVQAIKFVRQVSLMFYKLEVPYSQELVDGVLENFKRTDDELPLSYGVDESPLLSQAANLITTIFQDFDPKKIVPRHGPGAVATGERLEDKWEFSRLYESIHQVYPYYEYFIVGGARELVDRVQWYKGLTRLTEGTAKVILVPKDSRGPRLISCEPLEFQWIQQGLGRAIMSHLENFPLSKGHVNFTYQEVNQNLAMQSSITKLHATLDLKDASDRVSLQLVLSLFRNLPDLVDCIVGTRSTQTQLPSGELVRLNKFAPMGSALCFPIESVCFWALCVAGISLRAKLDYRLVAREVYVYGDDIIVPTTYATFAMDALESVGLLVNRQKSYHRGSFRESCGVDAFCGVDVTPVRVRKPFPSKKSDGTGYAAWVALANRLRLKGYVATSRHVFDVVERLYGKIPFGTFTSSFPCRVVDSPHLAEELNISYGFQYRTNPLIQCLEFNVRYLKNRQRASDLDGWQRLLRDSVMSFVDTDPSVVVVPRSTEIKRGWCRI